MRLSPVFAASLALVGFAAIQAGHAQDGVSIGPPDMSAFLPRTEADSFMEQVQARHEEFLTPVTVAQSALVSIQASGFRQVTLATNCKVGDRIILTPQSPLPSGYALGDAVCVAAGSMTMDYFTPQLGIGVSYSFVVLPTAVR